MNPSILDRYVPGRLELPSSYSLPYLLPGLCRCRRR